LIDQNPNFALNPDQLSIFYFPCISQELLPPKQHHKRILCYSVCNERLVAFSSYEFGGVYVCLSSKRFVRNDLDDYGTQ